MAEWIARPTRIVEFITREAFPGLTDTEYDYLCEVHTVRWGSRDRAKTAQKKIPPLLVAIGEARADELRAMVRERIGRHAAPGRKGTPLIEQRLERRKRP